MTAGDLLPESLEPESTNVHNDGGEIGFEIKYRKNEEEDVLNCTESDTLEGEVMNSEKSKENHSLVQTETEIKTEPDDRSSESMEDSQINIEHSGVDARCSSKSKARKRKGKSGAIISDVKEKLLHQSQKSRPGNGQKNQSRDSDSGKGEKGSLAGALSREHECSFCLENMRNLNDLLVHVVSHAGKNIQCQIYHSKCNKIEELQQNIQIHQKGKDILQKGGTILLSTFSPPNQGNGTHKYF